MGLHKSVANESFYSKTKTYAKKTSTRKKLLGSVALKSLFG